MTTTTKAAREHRRQYRAANRAKLQQQQRQWRQKWAGMSAEQLVLQYRSAIAEGCPVPLEAIKRVNSMLANHWNSSD